MQKGIEAVGEFVVTSREATKLFEPIEESLNEVARFVTLPIKLARGETYAQISKCKHKSATVNRP